MPRGRAGRLEHRAVRGLRIDGGAPIDAVGPRTITLADGTVVLLNDVFSGPGGAPHVIRNGLRIVTPSVPVIFTFASSDAGATGDPCGP